MEEAQAEFFTQISSDIPLPNAYKVTVENLDQFDETVSKLKQLQHVDTIRENKNLAKKLVALRQGITVVAIVIIAVLFLISVFIISNTIKLTVYSRRLEISIMKSVGATNSFEQLHFLPEMNGNYTCYSDREHPEGGYCCIYCREGCYQLGICLGAL